MNSNNFDVYDLEYDTFEEIPGYVESEKLPSNVNARELNVKFCLNELHKHYPRVIFTHKHEMQGSTCEIFQGDDGLLYKFGLPYHARRYSIDGTRMIVASKHSHTKISKDFFIAEWETLHSFQNITGRFPTHSVNKDSDILVPIVPKIYPDFRNIVIDEAYVILPMEMISFPTRDEQEALRKAPLLQKIAVMNVLNSFGISPSDTELVYDDQNNQLRFVDVHGLVETKDYADRNKAYFRLN